MPTGEYDDSVAAFVQQWFDILSRHEPVEELLPFVSDQGLDMTFPERTLRGHDDFRDWYRAVGETFADQTHVLEHLDTRNSGDRVHIDLFVVWTAKTVADGSVSSFRVHQNWTLRRRAGGEPPVIVTYRVGELVPVEI